MAPAQFKDKRDTTVRDWAHAQANDTSRTSVGVVEGAPSHFADTKELLLLDMGDPEGAAADDCTRLFVNACSICSWHCRKQSWKTQPKKTLIDVRKWRQAENV